MIQHMFSKQVLKPAESPQKSLVGLDNHIEQLVDFLRKQEEALEAQRMDNLALTAELQTLTTSLLAIIDQSQSFEGADRLRIVPFKPKYQSSPVIYASQATKPVTSFSSPAIQTPASISRLVNNLNSVSCRDELNATSSNVFRKPNLQE